ncbi:MAG: arsenate reductase ArsC [Nitrososphaerota archaeon]|jgi:protein-tyrosine-phosphatase|nr:arsenate reductase ArsC [Nitrososphaerota archaeon]MDG6912128.1 arsenate reductase ArsC [Nitrososphaerota archaeon]MDG6924623.1 arsenate reductase ArsC [Nitrososphaerota archaeon]MDG6941186.1 arsenate reductase ArsC [Nitrososphaerota archaeon]MDG6945759.1 arsenate reductase ArsC [Nitrososphaerota archaeon]
METVAGRGSGTRYLFVCVENAGRSQMAEAFARRAGLVAESAGTVPARSVNKTVADAMSELGLDLSDSKPKMLSMDMIDRADVVITMGCSVEKVCPRPMLSRMQKKVVDWGLDDPKGMPLPEVRRIRDEIERRVGELVRSKS